MATLLHLEQEFGVGTDHVHGASLLEPSSQSKRGRRSHAWSFGVEATLRVRLSGSLVWPMCPSWSRTGGWPEVGVPAASAPFSVSLAWPGGIDASLGEPGFEVRPCPSARTRSSASHVHRQGLCFLAGHAAPAAPDARAALSGWLCPRGKRKVSRGLSLSNGGGHPCLEIQGDGRGGPGGHRGE